MEYRSTPLCKLPAYPRNRIIVLIVVSTLLLALAGQLLHLSLFQHRVYLAKAQDNLYGRERLTYPRGNIVDRSGVVLATNQRVFSLTFSPYGMKDAVAQEVLEKISALTGKPAPGDITKILAARPRWTRHNLLSDVTQEAVLPFLERPDDFPGVRVREGFVRQYTFPIDLAHIIGYVGRLQPDEVDSYVRPRYLLDAKIGRTGLERQYEDQLAGYPGAERQRRDARGRKLADADIIEPSRPGDNLYLTVDSHLQSVAMELLRGKRGTLILMDAEDGALLVLASRPTYDANAPAAAVAGGEAVSHLNRALQGLYPPASTFKIAGAITALRLGIDPEARTVCRGRFEPEGWGHAFWCAHRNGHGPVSLAGSLKLSCNVYYYNLGLKLGFEPVLETARQLGYSLPTGIDLPGEKSGQIASSAHPAPGETLNLMIGQGTMLATPIQVARSFAPLANGGYLPTPHLVAAIGSSPETAETPERTRVSAGLTASQIGIIRKGLWGAANEAGGTAYSAGFPSHWGVGGKTGTAERPGNHEDAWFVGIFPLPSPRYVVLAQIEDADAAGGVAAAPLARDLLAEYFDDNGDAAKNVALSQE